MDFWHFDCTPCQGNLQDNTKRTNYSLTINETRFLRGVLSIREMTQSSGFSNFKPNMEDQHWLVNRSWT